MSQVPSLNPFALSTVFGGFGFGSGVGYAVLDPAKPAPEAAQKVEIVDPIDRSYYSLIARGSYPGFDTAPPWSFQLAWQMRRYSTIVLAHTVLTAPAIAGTQSIEILREDFPSADKMKEAAQEDILPTVMDWLPGMFECAHFGHFLMEVEWQQKNDRTVPAAYHSVLPGEAVLYRDEYRRLAGFEVAGEFRDARYALLAVNQPHIDPIFGHARNENCREEWWRIRQGEANADKTERKASGIQMGIGIPMGASFVGSDGKPIFGQDLAQKMINAAVQGQTFTFPLCPFEMKDIANKPELAGIPAVKIEKFDWGNIGPAIEAHLARNRDLKVDIMRAWHRPEREAMQGQHGTNAESETQGEIGTTDTELYAAQAMRQYSRQVLDRWAVTNYGPDAAGVLEIRQSPLSDPQQAFLQKLAVTLAQDSVTGPDVIANIDTRGLLGRVEAPLRSEDEVKKIRAANEAKAAEKAKQTQMQPPREGGGNVPVKVLPAIAASGNGNGHRSAVDVFHDVMRLGMDE